MGFSYRKSFKLAPGVRMTVSKSGVGYSVGRKGMRVTKRARGGVQATVRVPGTAMSYTTSTGRRRASTPNGHAFTRKPHARKPPRPASRPRPPAVLVPMTRRIKTERVLCLLGVLITVIGVALPPLLLLAMPCLLTGLVLLLRNWTDEMRWYRENQAAKAHYPRYRG